MSDTFTVYLPVLLVMEQTWRITTSGDRGINHAKLQRERQKWAWGEASKKLKEDIMRRLASGGLFAILSLVVASHAAYAVPFGPAQLMLSTAGTTLTVSDGGVVVCVGACAGAGVADVNPVNGVITYVGTVGANWFVNVTTGESKPVLGSAVNPSMDTNSVDTSKGAATGVNALTIKFSDGDFGPLPASSIVAKIGGTQDSGTAQYKVLFDPGNLAFAGGVVADTGVLAGNPIPGTTVGGLIAGGPAFSLTQVITLTHTAGGTTSFDARLTTVPEPSAMLLLGSGLVGLGYLRLRRVFKKS
jgi:hypothetical protein